MCAEHSKDPKPDDNEVCGCPLSPDDFYNQETSEIATCRVAKKSCRKHFLWEKMYRAEIDLKVNFELISEKNIFLANSRFDQNGPEFGGAPKARKWNQ